jgi:protein-disulfide isomerase
MSTTPRLTKRELREERRAARESREAAERARTARRRRLTRLGAATVAAAVVVAVAVVISSGGTAKAPPAPGATQRAAALVAGIPEKNGVLGSSGAKVSVTEYLDLQCPVCKTASAQLLPTLVNDYVRTGKVKLQARTLHFIGADSTRAAQVAAGAQAQGRLWPFMEAFYASQGVENSGYVTDSFLRGVARASGVDANRALAYADTSAARARVDAADSGAAKLGIDSTPTFVVQRAGGAPKVVGATGVQAAIQAALA